jgi:hypothetical protein
MASQPASAAADCGAPPILATSPLTHRTVPRFAPADLGRWPNTPLILSGVGLSFAVIAINSIISATCPITAFPYDDLTYIDGVWRVVQGQRSGTDFYNPIGFGLFHIGAAWWRVVGPDRSVLALTSATFSALIMLCASIICARRVWFSVPCYLLVCGVIAFEASGPSVYGWSFFSIGMAAFYNRLSSAALVVLFIQWFVEPRHFRHQNKIAELTISATLLNILFLLKISSLVIALAIIGSSWVVRPHSIRLFAKAVAIVGLLFIFMLVIDFMVTGVDPQSIFRDYREAAAVRSSLASSDGIWRVLKSANMVVCALLLMVYARKPPALSTVKTATAIAAYAVAQLGLNISNTQPATIVIAPACAVVLLSWRQGLALCQQQQDPGAGGTKLPTTWIPTVVCLIVLVPQALASAFGAGLVGAVAFGLARPTIVSSGNGLGLPVVDGFGDAERGIDFALNVNRGVAALRDLGVADKGIATIDYVNPFPSLLGTPSPKGVPVVWALGYMEQPSMILQPERLFGDACIVMLALHPTRVVEGSAELLASAAKARLSADFTVARQDEYWTIYRRENGCS